MRPLLPLPASLPRWPPPHEGCVALLVSCSTTGRCWRDSRAGTGEGGGRGGEERRRGGGSAVGSSRGGVLFLHSMAVPWFGNRGWLPLSCLSFLPARGSISPRPLSLSPTDVKNDFFGWLVRVHRRRRAAWMDVLVCPGCWLVRGRRFGFSGCAWQLFDSNAVYCSCWFLQLAFRRKRKILTVALRVGRFQCVRSSH